MMLIRRDMDMDMGIWCVTLFMGGWGFSNLVRQKENKKGNNGFIHSTVYALILYGI